ncbi:MAG: hypothetical protein ACKOI2_03095 [Actinomycetota bacterium]
MEGYTSPAWFALLSAVNLLRPSALLDLRQAVLLLSFVLSVIAAVCWIRVETVASKRSAAETGDGGENLWRRLASNQTRLNVPLVFLAAWYPIHSFGTSGLETPLQFITLTATVLYVWSGADRAWAAGAIAAALPLVRPELGLLSLLLLGWQWIRSRQLRSALISFGVLVATLITVTIFRVMYYGQFLPNTYYAKTDDKHGIPAGLIYLRDMMLSYGLHWVTAACVLIVVIPFLTGPAKALSHEQASRTWFLLSAFVMTTYVVLLGGDFMHARFLLTSVILLIAIFAGLGSRSVALLGKDRTTRVRLALAGTLVIFVATQYTTSVQRLLTRDGDKSAALFKQVEDQEWTFEKLNPELNEWKTDAHPWEIDGTKTSHLAQVLGTEIGTSTRGIGQFSFQAQHNHGDVYVYDTLGLTRPDVARLDMGRRYGRVGHAKEAPDVLVAANPRVDFHTPYFEGWRENASFKFDGAGFTIINLDLIDPLVERQIMSAEQARKLREWILSKLSGPKVDRNFVTFLTLRYHRDDEISARVRSLGDLDRSSAWRKWLDDTDRERRILEPDGCSGLNVAECVGRAIERQEASSFLTTENKPDWADTGQR